MKSPLLWIILLATTQLAVGQQTTLYNFTGNVNGAVGGRRPSASLISDGTYLYGTTSQGGSSSQNLGILFRVKHDGTGFQKLLDFEGVTNGGKPFGSLYFDGTFLYGMTQKGGTEDEGTIFKIMPDGSGYVKLKTFTGVNDGRSPVYGALISDGTYLYGMTRYGGSAAHGIVFRIKPDGTDFLTLYSFQNQLNGRYPYGSLFSDGTFLYGMTESGGDNDLGVIFKIMPDGTGFAKLLDFDGETKGYNPYGELISDGTHLYGMAYGGGTNNAGTIFKIKPDGSDFAKLWDFDGSTNGDNPIGSLTLYNNTLYGLTSRGGSSDAGTLFRISPDGSGFTKLLDFVDTNGRFPLGSLLLDGNVFYGMASEGGTLNQGTVFKFQDMVSGIGDRDFSLRFAVWPNPTQGTFTLELPATVSTYTLEVHNLMGALIYTRPFIRQSDPLAVDLSAFPKGVYMVKLSDGTRQGISKIVLQ